MRGKPRDPIDDEPETEGVGDDSQLALPGFDTNDLIKRFETRSKIRGVRKFRVLMVLKLTADDGCKMSMTLADGTAFGRDVERGLQMALDDQGNSEAIKGFLANPVDDGQE